MAPKKFDPNPVGQVFLDAYTEKMGRIAYTEGYEIEEKVSNAYKEFFNRMQDSIGGGSTPGIVLNVTGERWADISPDWAAAKGADGYNQFYYGLGPKKWDKQKGGAFSTEIASKTPEQRYGPVSVTLQYGRKGLDISGVRRDVKLGRYRYKGRFVSPKDIGLRLKMVSFPKVTDEKHLARSFSPRVRRIMKYNEPFGQPAKHARPFIQPFFEFYAEKVLPDALRKALK